MAEEVRVKATRAGTVLVSIPGKVSFELTPTRATSVAIAIIKAAEEIRRKVVKGGDDDAG